MAILKITGIWKGVLEVDLEHWTVVQLREAVAKLSKCDPNTVKLISGGKILKDDETRSLFQIDIAQNSKIYATNCEDPRERLAREERARYFRRISNAANAIAKRNAKDGELDFGDYNLDVEDQSGTMEIFLSKKNHRFALKGLMLQTKGKRLIAKGNYNDALKALLMADEAFNSYGPVYMCLDADNASILQIDIVWCYLMLRDIQFLSDAARRLVKAKQGFARASNRKLNFHLLDLYPERALVMRQELLEGVVAYHTGQLGKARKALTSASEMCAKLKLPDEALSRVMSFGFTELEAKRALRIHNHDVEEAIDFLVEMTTKELQRKHKTIHIEKFRHDHEDLGGNENPQDVSAIWQDLWKSRRDRITDRWDAKMSINEIVELGFERSEVAHAFTARFTMQDTLRILAVQFPKGLYSRLPDPDVVEDPPDDIEAEEPNVQMQDENIEAEESDAEMQDETDEEGESDSEMEDEDSEAEERDVRMENELYEDIAGTHIYKDYDHEVNLEWQAIIEYLSQLEGRNDF